MSDYSYFHRALALTGGKRSLTRDEMKALGVGEEVGFGFFRKRKVARGMFVPVAIFEHGQGDARQPVALVDGKQVSDVTGVWLHSCPHPVLEANYRARIATGKWPDEDAAVSESLEPPPPGPTLGDNQAPPETDEERIARQIEAASANLKDYALITDDVTAGKAQSTRSRLLELAGEADGLRVKEKAPHLAAGKSVDDKWRPVVQAGEGGANGIRDALTVWVNKKRADEAEAARLARVEAQRLEALQASPVTGENAPLPSMPAAAPVERAKEQVAGSYGRAAGVRTVQVAVITDLDALYNATKQYKQVREFFQGLADRAAKAGVPVAGVTFEEQAKVV